MLVFSALSPHPPILIPGVGKNNLNKLKKTVKALKSLEQELYASKPETIIIISPHGQILDNAFTINLNPQYLANFKEFGDFSTELKFKGDPILIQEIRADDEMEKEIPLVLVSKEEIDHGISVPLYYLTQHLKEIKIIPVSYSALALKIHLKFGKFLQEQILNSNKRVAVIASGDLSHCLTKKSPGGYHKDGKIFDQKLIKLLKNKNVEGILNLNKNLIQNTKECGLKSIIIILGILNQSNYQSEILSYEAPFGVGYAVINFRLV